MHEAVRTMLAGYPCRTRDDCVNALRQVLQHLALLGLWRGKLFEHAAFYGGTALRALHGLDRFSEDLDFSLLRPATDFALEDYRESLLREIGSFGFHVEFEQRPRPSRGAIASAFLKTSPYRELLAIGVGPDLLSGQHHRQLLRIRIDIDTDPPEGFQTESRYVLLPVPFAVRVYALPDLLASKIHAILCRRWRARVKGRDWYDLVWYAARHPRVRLSHLESRLRHSGDYGDAAPLGAAHLAAMLSGAVESLDVTAARSEVAPFVSDPRAVELWSRPFFHDVVSRIQCI